MENHLMQCFKNIGLFFQIMSLAHDPDNEVEWGELTLIREKSYTKKIVDSAEKFKLVAPEVMIFLCHGKRRGKTPSAACFVS
jgi:hypothetical protein